MTIFQTEEYNFTYRIKVICRQNHRENNLFTQMCDVLFLLEKMKKITQDVKKTNVEMFKIINVIMDSPDNEPISVYFFHCNTSISFDCTTRSSRFSRMPVPVRLLISGSLSTDSWPSLKLYF